MISSKLGLKPIGTGRTMGIGGNGGHDNQRNIFYLKSGHFQGRSGSFQGQVRSSDVRIGHPSFTDSGPLGNPFVGGIKDFFKVPVV